MPDEGTFLDRGRCQMLVAQLLVGQGWRLVDAGRLADCIWRALAAEPPGAASAAEAVQRRVLAHYAAALHDGCCQGLEQAWSELDSWLQKRARALVGQELEQERLVQEALLRLHGRLRQAPIRAPAAFLAYALRTLQNTHVDLYRRARAARRRSDRATSLEAQQADGGGLPWEETIGAPGQNDRGAEAEAVAGQMERQLLGFFRLHLPTEAQRRVAELHFLRGLAPAEIARLLGKRPHEIRMVKVRVVHALRTLPAEARATLFDLLGETMPGEAAA